MSRGLIHLRPCKAPAIIGLYLLNRYPDTIDFTKYGTYTISYSFLELLITYEKIKLNPKEEDFLDCKYLHGLLQCIVDYGHFQGEEDGYYFTQYNYSENKLNSNVHLILN